jgi:predicted aspartyl protease
MPEFAFQSASLEAFGPTVKVEVRVSTQLARILLAQRKQVPPAVPITAVIDTGSEWCLFTPDVFAKLGIEPFDVARVTFASGRTEDTNLYDVDLDFSGHRIQGVSALEAKLAGVPCEGLIGRNLLTRALFVYDGRTNRYSLSF